MSQIELPDYLKDISDDTAKNMVTSGGGGAPRISIRGRQFRFIKDGDEISKQTDPIHVIILGVVPDAHMAKTWYEHGYQPGSTDPPDCSAFFGIAPDSWVENPQHPTCKGCPNNKWGSAVSMKGKKAKACKDSKRLMVVNAKEAKEDKPDIYIFSITIASLKALSEYGKFLISNKLPMAAVITKIEFVDAEFPQVELKFMSVLKEELGVKMLDRSTTKEWLEGVDQIAAPQPTKMIAQPDNSGPPDDGAPPISDSDILEKW